MATTPHSSWNLSNMRFECPLVSGPQRRDVPGTQRISPLPDLHTCLNCSADHWSFDTMSFGNIGNVFRMGGRDQNPRGSLVEGQQFGAEVAIQIDLRADFV